MIHKVECLFHDFGSPVGTLYATDAFSNQGQSFAKISRIISLCFGLNKLNTQAGRHGHLRSQEATTKSLSAGADGLSSYRMALYPLVILCCSLKGSAECMADIHFLRVTH